ncbi:MAG: AmmeMemoRadiSam system protein B [Terriglobia bacterium]
MPGPLARLRGDLDFMPSPVEDRPGLLIRDSFRYSDAVLIVPPALVESLSCFDGQQTRRELRESLALVAEDEAIPELEQQMIDALSGSGFLEDENYLRMKDAARRAFVEAPLREPAHAGSGYPTEPGELRSTMDEWMGDGAGAASDGGLVGIAAPHVSPAGGYLSYRSAYRLLAPEYRDRTFVVLGTSHYGQPEKFGLTRKPYVTPFGATVPDTALVDELAAAAPGAIAMEDYCHAVEHSIEFQVLFLQSIYGPDIRVLPILCGSFARSIYRGGKPEADEGVERFLNALGEAGEREKNRLFWVLGIDMAHMGRRYGDTVTAVANEGEMLGVDARDRRRIHSIAEGDAEAFWDNVQENHDDLKWCGSSPLYTFLKANPGARGRLERYEQWNIDPQSIVSFAGISFR